MNALQRGWILISDGARIDVNHEAIRILEDGFVRLCSEFDSLLGSLGTAVTANLIP